MENLLMLLEIKPHCPRNETSSVSYVTPRYTGTRQGLNEWCSLTNNSVCLASFVLIAHHDSSPEEKRSFVIIFFWISFISHKEAN